MEELNEQLRNIVMDIHRCLAFIINNADDKSQVLFYAGRAQNLMVEHAEIELDIMTMQIEETAVQITANIKAGARL